MNNLLVVYFFGTTRNSGILNMEALTVVAVSLTFRRWGSALYAIRSILHGNLESVVRSLCLEHLKSLLFTCVW